MKATKKLILATISLVAASSLTVGSTFAWFSYRSDVELGPVDFLVGSGSENLQVAVAAVGVAPEQDDFSYSLSTQQLKNKIGNVTYKPLTVSGVSDNTVSETNLIQLEAEDSVAVSTTSTDYAAFDLVFRYTPAKSSNSMPYLLLDFGSKITADPEEDNDYNPTVICKASKTLSEGNYGKTLNENDTIKARARDAARVAFLFEDNGTTKNKIWAPSENYTISPTTDTSDVVQGFHLGNLASDYRHEQTGASVVSAPVYDSRVYAAPDPKSNVTNTTYSQIAKFPVLSESATYSELKITVKVWLEGKDGDCLESVQNDRFSFLLKFRTGSSIVSDS